MKGTTAVVLVVVAIIVGVLIDRASIRMGGGGPKGTHAPVHKLTAILIDSDCQDGKEQVVSVKSKGKVDWYVVNECAAYSGNTVTIDFVDANGNSVAPPGQCKCSDTLNGNGSAKLHLDAKEVTSLSEFPYNVWVGTAANPKQKQLTDPKLEIDP